MKIISIELDAILTTIEITKRELKALEQSMAEGQRRLNAYIAEQQADVKVKTAQTHKLIGRLDVLTSLIAEHDTSVNAPSNTSVGGTEDVKSIITEGQPSQVSKRPKVQPKRVVKPEQQPTVKVEE